MAGRDQYSTIQKKQANSESVDLSMWSFCDDLVRNKTNRYCVLRKVACILFLLSATAATKGQEVFCSSSKYLHMHANRNSTLQRREISWGFFFYVLTRGNFIFHRNSQSVKPQGINGTKKLVWECQPLYLVQKNSSNVFSWCSKT